MNTQEIIGQILGNKFHILKLIGQGGMGNVYLALQKPIDRKVALKILSTEIENDQVSRDRFLREAKASSQLSSIHTATIYDFGEVDKYVYLAMEYLEGETLDDKLEREKKLDFQEVLVIFEQVLRSLDEAHNKGIVHRDIKPANIFLTKDNNGNMLVKVLDFGIARFTQHNNEDVKLTRPGLIFGTPKYISPEQARGKDVDARSDIYSLGALIYEALKGGSVFEDNDIITLLDKHLNEKPVSLKKYVTEIPDWFDDLVINMLAKDPNKRPASARHILAELIDNSTIVKRRDSLISQIEAGKKAGKFKIYILLSVALIAIISIIVLINLLIPPKKNNNLNTPTKIVQKQISNIEDAGIDIVESSDVLIEHDLVLKIKASPDTGVIVNNTNSNLQKGKKGKKIEKGDTCRVPPCITKDIPF